jgi:hypothetical protein
MDVSQGRQSDAPDGNTAQVGMAANSDVGRCQYCLALIGATVVALIMMRLFGVADPDRWRGVPVLAFLPPA